MIKLEPTPPTVLAEAVDLDPVRPHVHRATLTADRRVICSCGTWQLPGQLDDVPSPASTGWCEVLLPWTLHLTGARVS